MSRRASCHSHGCFLPREQVLGCLTCNARLPRCCSQQDSMWRMTGPERYCTVHRYWRCYIFSHRMAQPCRVAVLLTASTGAGDGASCAPQSVPEPPPDLTEHEILRTSYLVLDEATYCSDIAQVSTTVRGCLNGSLGTGGSGDHSAHDLTAATKHSWHRYNFMCLRRSPKLSRRATTQAWRALAKCPDASSQIPGSRAKWEPESHPTIYLGGPSGLN